MDYEIKLFKYFEENKTNLTFYNNLIENFIYLTCTILDILYVACNILLFDISK